MQKRDIELGGEQSGHIVMSRFAKTGDGLASALQVLAYMIIKKKPASELLRPFSLYPQILENISISKKIPLEKIDGFKKKVDEVESKGMRQLIRYSGTENLLRILLEGKDVLTLNKTVEDLSNFFKKALG
jgi:phosphoglucosamine mutase